MIQFVRAGYSANTSLVWNNKDSVMAIESLLQFDHKTEEPYVEVKQRIKSLKEDVKIGISDESMLKLSMNFENVKINGIKRAN